VCRNKIKQKDDSGKTCANLPGANLLGGSSRKQFHDMAVDMLPAGGENKITSRLVSRYCCGWGSEQDDGETFYRRNR
jgi:hypothetical protein